MSIILVVNFLLQNMVLDLLDFLKSTQISIENTSLIVPRLKSENHLCIFVSVTTEDCLGLYYVL